MKNVPKAVIEGCCAMLSAYVKVSPESLRDFLTCERPRGAMSLREIAERNQINLYTLHHWVKRNEFQPVGVRRGKRLYNEAALVTRYNEAQAFVPTTPTASR